METIELTESPLNYFRHEFVLQKLTTLFLSYISLFQVDEHFVLNHKLLSSNLWVKEGTENAGHLVCLSFEYLTDSVRFRYHKTIVYPDC